MTDHAHHFRIETPTGPTVEGRCKHCGETRTFAATHEANPYYMEQVRRGSQRGKVTRWGKTG